MTVIPAQDRKFRVVRETDGPMGKLRAEIREFRKVPTAPDTVRQRFD
jgi:hypothetical protein